MKAGWAKASLASVSRVFTDGNWIESKDQSSSGIRLVQTGNVGEGKFKDRRDKARFINDATFKKLKCFEVLPGDCLISRLPDPVGRACIIPDTGDKMITAVDCSIVRPNVSKIDREFLVYFTQTCNYLRDVDDLCSGTTRRRISRKNLGKVSIPLPHLEEQQRIVAVLDEAFEGLARARAHAEANLRNARELFAAELYQVFSRELSDAPNKTFESITNESLIGLVRNKNQQGPDRQYIYVKMQDIGNDDRFLGAAVDRVDCTPGEASRYLVGRGDFLFNTRNSRELVGKSCIIGDDFDHHAVFNNNIMRVRFSLSVNPKYVALAFKTDQVKIQLEAMKSGTTSVVAIYHKSLKNLLIRVPSRAAQQASSPGSTRLIPLCRV